MDVESVDYVLSTTRAVRKKLDLDRPVETEVLTECLKLALQAPSPGNTQQWRWLVVRDQGVMNPSLRTRLVAHSFGFELPIGLLLPS